MPTIGKLDQRVELQAATETPNASRGTKYTYATYATVWARVELDQDGVEIQQGGRLQPQRFWRVTIRRRTDIVAKHAVLYRGKLLHIRSVGDDALRQEFQVLVCVESAP